MQWKMNNAQINKSQPFVHPSYAHFNIHTHKLGRNAMFIWAAQFELFTEAVNCKQMTAKETTNAP